MTFTSDRQVFSFHPVCMTVQSAFQVLFLQYWLFSSLFFPVEKMCEGGKSVQRDTTWLCS